MTLQKKTNISRDNIDSSTEFCHLSRVDVVFKKWVIFHLNWMTVTCMAGIDTLVVNKNPNRSFACRQVHHSNVLIWYRIPGHYEVNIHKTVGYEYWTQSTKTILVCLLNVR